MFDNAQVLALIPARGGSKGVLHKNSRVVFGKPLIAWTIQAAKAAGFLDRIIVSTDDRQIAALSRDCGVEVPFMRPASLSADTSGAIEVAMHALSWLHEHESKEYKWLVYLQPTSPLRTGADIVAAFETLRICGGKAVVSVCRAEHHPYWMNTLAQDFSMRDFKKPEAQASRQEMPVFYRINGAIYISETGYLKEQGDFIGPQTYAHIMPQERSLDIDTELDLQISGYLLSKR